MPSDASPVEVTNADPIAVTVERPKQGEPSRVEASARIDADKLRVEDQRRISGIWERTQQIIALSVVEITLFVAAVKAIEPILRNDTADATTAGVAFVFLASVSNLVIGFYFGRTNHQRVGGAASATDDVSGR